MGFFNGNNKVIPKSVHRVLVVGSWSKEEITIENLKRNKDLQVFAYMDTKNPGIISKVDAYTIGDLSDVKNIVNFSQQNNIDLVLITTAEPLAHGIVDELQNNDIAAFGPTKKAARLESDKAFTRNLMKKHNINALPEFQVFDEEHNAVEFAENLDWRVAIKPIGLTEGLGVKVYGDQLHSKEEVKQYIHQVFTKSIGGASKVLIEEKMQGEEFTIQCFVHDDQIVPTPAVQDFKKLLPGDEGPNTASMGSYSTNEFLLPFMQQKDYDTALQIIQDTLDAYYAETGERCQGFLYGQFIITTSGIKLVEYNFRPGDPEWMNTICVLKNNICEVILKLLQNKKVSLEFEAKATVCKYIVPFKYPRKLHQRLDVSFDEEEIRKNDVSLYYSCGLDEQKRLNVGSERGISFIAKGDSIERANEKVEQAISTVIGDFRHRPDIGTKALIQEKINNVAKVRT